MEISFIFAILQEKIVSLRLAPIPIKYLPKGTKVLRLLVAPIIKEVNYYDAYQFVACKFANGSYQIQGVDFDQ